MIKSINFIDTKYGELIVAGRAIKDYAKDQIDVKNLLSKNSNGVNILIKTNIVGISNEYILELLEEYHDLPICLTVDNNAILVMTKEPLSESEDMQSVFTDIATHANKHEIELIDINLIQNMYEFVEFNSYIKMTLNDAALSQEVQMIEPETVHLSYDTKLGDNVIIEPNVYIGPGVTIRNNVTIKSFSYIEGSDIQDGAIIGPFARIRGKTQIAENVKVGNFVEIKNSNLKKAAKICHLSYIGDSDIGENVNIGAGVVTCNYDGKKKHRTYIGNNSFIGTNSSLIAPIQIGNNCLIGAGSFINRNVPNDSFAYGRSKQEIRDKKIK